MTELDVARWREQVARDGFWFVDVPRTGSTSLRVELGRRYGPAHGKANVDDPKLRTEQLVTDHLPAREVRGALGANVWHDLFTFAFVRDPWSRTESMWRWRLREGSISPDMSLRDYVRKLALGDVHVTRYGPHVRSCSHYVLDEHGNAIVDLIAPFDQRSEALAAISERLPGAPSLGQVHTQRGDTQVAASWDDEMVDLVRWAYADDVQHFGFEFQP